MKAFIITIGDEILLGQILDTNSRFMSSALAGIGVETLKMVSVSDKKEEIKKALEEGVSSSDLILVSGGLGPTKDDITKGVLAEFFGSQLVFNEEVYGWVREYFRGKTSAMNEYNKSQAYLPSACIPIKNEKGTACAMWFERGGKVLVSMPGVPFELENLISSVILPRIKRTFKCSELAYKMLGVYDKPEAELAMVLSAFEDALPSGISLAYLPSPGYIRLRLTAKGAGLAKLDDCFEKLKQSLGGLKYAVIKSGDNSELLERLSKIGTVAAAESCTGGNISAMITARPGASAYYLGGVTAYSNEVKISALGVKREALEKYGAVSKEVALQMAEGVRRLTGADWGVSTTGIAGPSGGSAEKPVGTVWIAVSGRCGAKAEKFCFSSVRERNIGKASLTALQMLVDFAEENRP
ncbi:CinA family nicotinamide mononucleotide deamidase-related protein [Candidatus Proelusimicrobium excrementi]|uniref:CinA family nicotinamide mononucleotide deamidase-related protein n=1 Tax=Candidatus Proelusimicrobium excrementi TaxID=3416222 RepID=UPI003CB56E34|nr:CinA family nicotinamide mononucleotide deamidase-related protein [Elusimicrobiaceae bacterium]